MAFRLYATTDTDAELLALIRELAWKQRVPVSQVVREAFEQKLHGNQVPKKAVTP